MKARVFALLLALVCGAEAGAEAPRVKLGAPADVQALLALRGLSREELMSILKLAPGDVQPDAAYQKLHGVARLHNGAIHPGHFFFRGEQLQLIYIGDAALLRTLAPAAIRRELGSAGTPLSSRAGKRSNQYVHPDKGFAYSETDGVLDFVEIFRPLSLDAYRAQIYEEVGPFRK